MISLELETEPIAVGVAVENAQLILTLADGRTLAIPLEWYPRLRLGTDTERNNWNLLGQGEAIEWPDLDEHIGVSSLVAGRRSGESKASQLRWMNARRKGESKSAQ